MFHAPGTGGAKRPRPEDRGTVRRAKAGGLVHYAVLAVSLAVVVPLSSAGGASASTFRPALGHGGTKTGSPVVPPKPPTSTTTTVPSHATHGHPRPAR
jgi:hypothetical protein